MKRENHKAPSTILFLTSELSIAPVDENNLRPILEIYRQSEDFLSLVPTSKASMKMVRDDIEHSKDENGRYCCIRNSSGHIVGVLDFIPITKETGTSFLSLMMISFPWRRRGYGKAIVAALEQYLIKKYKTTRIKSAVQTNNTDAIQFWREMGYSIDSKVEHRPDKTIVYNVSKELRK